VGKVTGWKVGRCRHVQVSELFSVEECDQAVMDFLTATEAGKFPANYSSGMERAQGSGLRSGRGGDGVIPFFLSFCLSLIISLSLNFSFICQRGRRVAEGELRHLAGSPGGGGGY